MPDVLVIGGGPAGCFAAAHCANAGLHTTLLRGRERDNTVPVIESLHPGVESLLKKFGAGYCIGEATKGLYGGITSGSQYTPFGADGDGAWLGHHVDRSLFHHAMVKFAAAQGVQIRQNATVSELLTEADRVTGVVTVDGRALTARYVIDASGYVRLAGKKLQFAETFYSPPLVAWAGVTPRTRRREVAEPQTARFEATGDSWTWFAPLRSGACAWTRLSPQAAQVYGPPPELSDVQSTGRIRVSNRRWRVFRPLCKEGILLCGDAAGIIDPAAGQGILNALVSGLEAAATVSRIIAQPPLEAFFLAQYDDWFFETFRDKVEKLKSFYALHDLHLHE